MDFLASSRSSSPKMFHVLIAICVMAALACRSVDAQVLANVTAGAFTLQVNLSSSTFLEELNISKSDFPSDFIFGVGTAAAQTEGSPNEGGRGQSVWDYRAKILPDTIMNSDKFFSAVDGYKRYKEDILLIKDLGVNSYRFSISWTRILPNGSLSGGINQEGVDHYNRLIDELVKNGPCNFGGNSSTEPYIVAHNVILAHATVAKLYREKYQAKQKGEVGIVLVTPYYVPYSKSQEDQDAANRLFDFYLGWFMDPFVFGEYPKSMRELVKERLPEFTEEEKVMVKGSLDFLAINYYASSYAKNKPPSSNEVLRYTLDVAAEIIDGKDAPGLGHGNWPEGLEKLMNYIKDKYNNPKVYIAENGIAGVRNDALDLNVQLNDVSRIIYVVRHLYRLNKAIKNGVNVKGYFHWTLMDDFEWGMGFRTRFGLYYVDFNRNYTRIPKNSVLWFHNFLNGTYESDIYKNAANRFTKWLKDLSMN
ncbi:hypothetical protein ACE6H2_017830 [Prunus campanulata]